MTIWLIELQFWDHIRKQMTDRCDSYKAKYIVLNKELLTGFLVLNNNALPPT